MEIRTLEIVARLPRYLVQGILDRGTTETKISEVEVEKDDLRLAIQLSGGHLVFIEPEQHLIFTSDEVCILEYVESN